MTPLSGWENFYVILGSSAGALIGLQFVVVTLMGERPGRQDMELAGAAFGTPTVVHFCVVLLLSAVINIPWRAAMPAAIIWGITGAFGIGYIAVTIRRMRIQRLYKPTRDDWWFYAILPLVGYVVLTASAWVARTDLSDALLMVAGSAVMLLLLSIRNSWDSVTYHVFVARARKPGSGEQKS